MGADGTPTMRLDILVDAAVTEVVEKHRVNLLSEEIGVIDIGSPVTLVVDPVDGTANAAAGVPLSALPGLSRSTVSRGGAYVLVGRRRVLARRAGRPAPTAPAGARPSTARR